jgi:hypothetical protein
VLLIFFIVGGGDTVAEPSTESMYGVFILTMYNEDFKYTPYFFAYIYIHVQYYHFMYLYS